MGAAEGQVLDDAAGIVDGGHEDGNLGALGGLEAAGAEGEHFVGVAAGAFGVDTEGADIPLHPVGGGENGTQRLAVVLAVNGEEAGGGHDGACQRNVEVFRLGDEVDAALAEGFDGDHGVEAGAVVAHQQEGLIGDMFQSFHADAHIAEEEDDLHRPLQQEAGEGTVFRPDFRLVHEEGNDERNDDIEKGKTEESDNRPEQKEAEEGQLGIAGKDAVEQRACRGKDHE